MERIDCIVVGAGIVGLAVARALALAGRDVLVLERAAIAGSETSSRNSEVIHAGIYYPPGSLKAKLCVTGRKLLYRYCRERDIRHLSCGKFIVATTPSEASTLQRYLTTARANGVDNLEQRTAADVKEAEPAVQCVAGLWSPATGIVDSHELMQSFIADIEGAGGMLAYHCNVDAIDSRDDGYLVQITGADEQELLAQTVVNAAGLGAHALAQGTNGLRSEHIPTQYLAKGHYYTLGGRSPFRHLIYPVANTAGLGIHVTLDIAGTARFGPDVEWIDHTNYAFDDTRRDQFAAAIRRYYPALDDSLLQPGYTGIRPKISGRGAAPADFRIDGAERHGLPGLVNLFGIESPGLTASLAIGERVVAMVEHGNAVDQDGRRYTH